MEGRALLNRFTREGLVALSCVVGESFFVDASQHPSTKLFPVWKTFSSRFKKVSTRNASAKKLSSAVRVNVAKMVQCGIFQHEARENLFYHGGTEGIDCHPERSSRWRAKSKDLFTRDDLSTKGILRLALACAQARSE